VLITNDGATILKKMKVIHPAAKMVRRARRAHRGGRRSIGINGV